MQTAGDGAADDNDDPVRGNWRDQLTNEYTVTRYQDIYSVTITHKQGNKCGTTETLKGIISRDTSGDYTWGITHKLHLRGGSLLRVSRNKGKVS